MLKSQFPVDRDFLKSLDIYRPKAKSQSILDLTRLYGVKALINSEHELTKRHLSLVLGGRIQNEQPERDIDPGELVISMDLVSCYGKGLEQAFFPIGHPCMVYYPVHKPTEWPTLKAFLKQWENELEPFCWYAVVDTAGVELSFDQDLLFSKYIPSDVPCLEGDELVWDPTNDDVEEVRIAKGDETHIKGRFGLTSRHVTNGILTFASLSLLSNVASPNEWGELQSKLRVKAAMIYPKSRMVVYNGDRSFEDWQNKACQHEGSLDTYCSLKGHGVHDTRPGPWLKFPLARFISPLLKERAALKKQLKDLSPGSVSYRIKDTFQRSIKGVVNTLYASMASPYFEISSPCCANQITDMARSVCWMMDKAGLGLTSITDGCESLLNEVAFWKDSFPGLNTLYRLARLEELPKDSRKKARVWSAPLGGR